jgi:hypothetical protein
VTLRGRRKREEAGEECKPVIYYIWIPYSKSAAVSAPYDRTYVVGTSGGYVLHAARILNVVGTSGRTPPRPTLLDTEQFVTLGTRSFSSHIERERNFNAV